MFKFYVSHYFWASTDGRGTEWKEIKNQQREQLGEHLQVKTVFLCVSLRSGCNNIKDGMEIYDYSFEEDRFLAIAVNSATEGAATSSACIRWRRNELGLKCNQS